MHVSVSHSRGSEDVLDRRAHWQRLLEVLGSINRDELIGRQRTLTRMSGRAPRGGQRALNDVLNGRLEAAGWDSGGRVFKPGRSLPGWRLSFLGDDVGVVVCTQNVGYLAQKLLTLQVAAGPPLAARWAPSAVEVGILVAPASSLKSWSRMDGTVATYGDALAQNGALEGIVTAPLAVLGLEASDPGGSGWETTEVFPGRAA